MRANAPVMPQILLAGPDPGWLDRVGAALADFGEVRTVSSIVRALQAVREQPPDLVIADCHLAGIEEVDLVRRIREQGPGAQVILLVGRDGWDRVLQGLADEQIPLYEASVVPEVLRHRVEALLYPSGPGGEQRRHPRKAVTMDVSGWDAEARRRYELKTFDISMGGVGFRSLLSWLPPGRRLALRLQLLPPGRGELNLSGCVAWCSATRLKGMFHGGISFYELDETRTRGLEELIYGLSSGI